MGCREKQEFLRHSASPSQVKKCHKPDVSPSGCVFLSNDSNDIVLISRSKVGELNPLLCKADAVFNCVRSLCQLSCDPSLLVSAGH